MDPPATDDLTFAPPVSLPPEFDFQGGRVTRDGDWCWATAADADRGLSETLALQRRAEETALQMRTASSSCLELVENAWCDIPSSQLRAPNGPHPNPSPDARERGFLRRVFAPDSAWLRQFSHPDHHSAPLVRASGEGLG